MISTQPNTIVTILAPNPYNMTNAAKGRLYPQKSMNFQRNSRGEEVISNPKNSMPISGFFKIFFPKRGAGRGRGWGFKGRLEFHPFLRVQASLGGTTSGLALGSCSKSLQHDQCNTEPTWRTIGAHPENGHKTSI